jgi:hypothetical protein
VEAFTVYQAALNSISAHADSADGVPLNLPDQEEGNTAVVSLSASLTSKTPLSTSPASTSSSALSMYPFSTSTFLVYKPKHILV